MISSISPIMNIVYILICTYLIVKTFAKMESLHLLDSISGVRDVPKPIKQGLVILLFASFSTLLLYLFLPIYSQAGSGMGPWLVASIHFKNFAWIAFGERMLKGLEILFVERGPQLRGKTTFPKESNGHAVGEYFPLRDEGERDPDETGLH